MLDHVEPPLLDRDGSSTNFDAAPVDVWLAHAEREDWTIWIGIEEDQIIVDVAGAHEHFFAADDEEEADPERPWTSLAVDFVAEILHGHVEIEATYRGQAAVSVEHFVLDDRGERSDYSHYVGLLRPARLFLWRGKRTEIETPSWF